MSNVQVCQFDDNLVEELKKFRFSRSTADRAIVMKIDTTKMKQMYKLRIKYFFQ